MFFNGQRDTARIYRERKEYSAALRIARMRCLIAITGVLDNAFGASPGGRLGRWSEVQEKTGAARQD